MPESTKKVLAWAGIFFLVAGGLGYLVAAVSFWNWIELLEPRRTIVVEGEGRATLKPDIATVSFSVISEGKDPVSLQADNNQKMTQAIEAVKTLGIEAKDIKTTGYNLSPRYVYRREKGRSEIDGYTLTQKVTVKVRNLDKVASVLAALPPAGINQIHGPNFSVDDPDEFLAAARAEAFAKAKRRATELAATAGVRLGKVVTFSESGGQPPIVFAREFSTLGVGGEGSTQPPIEIGSEEVVVRINVTYQIR